MTSGFFSHNLSKKNSPPPKQTVVQVACCFRIERQVIFTLALHSVRYSPPPPKKKKKNYLSANVVLTQLVRYYFFVPPKEKGKKQRKNKRAKVLNEACTYIWVQSFRSGWMVG